MEHFGSRVQTAAQRVSRALGHAGAQARLAASGAADVGRDAGRLAVSAVSVAAERVRNADWDTLDAAAGIAAGLAGTAVDILLVRLPEDKTNTSIRSSPDWSPLTVHLNKQGIAYYEDNTSSLQKGTGVPYDAVSDPLTDTKTEIGLSSNYHRLMALGHDPAVGWLVGTVNTMLGFGTYADKQGHLHPVVHYDTYGRRFRGPVDALRTQWRHQWSDVFTSAGLPVPFMSLVQLARFPSPFILPEGNAQRDAGRGGPSNKRRVRAYWTGVARHMYRHGYHSRHFLTMATVPITVELVGRAYWLATRPLRPVARREWSRMESIVATGHGVAVAGTVFKTRFVYDRNPTAVNAAELTVAAVSLAGVADRTVARRRAASDRSHRASAGVVDTSHTFMAGTSR